MTTNKDVKFIYAIRSRNTISSRSIQLSAAQSQTIGSLSSNFILVIG